MSWLQVTDCLDSRVLRGKEIQFWHEQSWAELCMLGLWLLPLSFFQLCLLPMAGFAFRLTPIVFTNWLPQFQEPHSFMMTFSRRKEASSALCLSLRMKKPLSLPEEQAFRRWIPEKCQGSSKKDKDVMAELIMNKVCLQIPLRIDVPQRARFSPSPHPSCCLPDGGEEHAVSLSQL